MESKNILIVSYALAPDNKVGALRPTYWYNNLPKHSNYKVSVVTAEQDAKGEGVYIVPQTRTFKAYHLIKDVGILWQKDLKSFFKKNLDLEIDYLIITGSPFMHFGIGAWMKKKFGCKVLLDYRDPFAQNPGFKNSGFKIKIKQFFERKFNRQADGLITVNKYCGDLLAFFNDKPSNIIQNGYDETVVPTLKTVDLNTPIFTYTGKFYFDPKPIVDAISSMQLRFTYAGGDGHYLSSYNSPLVKTVGIVPYPDAVQLMADSDVCIIQTYGEDFMSTTKVFDYVRCKRVVLIVSNNHLERGSLHEELKGYDNVFWCKNDEQSIQQAIRKIQKATFSDENEFDVLKHSRLGQMKKLIKFIADL